MFGNYDGRSQKPLQEPADPTVTEDATAAIWTTSFGCRLHSKYPPPNNDQNPDARKNLSPLDACRAVEASLLCLGCLWGKIRLSLDTVFCIQEING